MTTFPLLRSASRLVRAGALAARPLFWLDLLAIGNLAFLGVDIVVAHAVNAFADPMEWAPVIFSAIGTLAMLAALRLGGLVPTIAGRGSRRRAMARLIGLAVGGGSIVVGVAGLVFHLRSAFFADQTLRNLVYTAPFSAPLAYSGVGLLLILNRTVDDRTREWAWWVVVLALGGFLGNFSLSLADHAANGFFRPLEWAGVIAGAAGVGALAGVLAAPGNRPMAWLAAGVMAAEMVVGLLGFGLHVAANLAHPAAGVADRFLYGAPAFAPLLFDNIALIALIGLWGLTWPDADTTTHGVGEAG
ncbi:MAG: hypothetical protein U0800_07590 [Isosphaeraceae bacterium]